MPETAEELSQHRDVQEALDQTGGRKTRTPAKSDRFWFATHVLLLIGCAVLYYLSGSRLVPLSKEQVDLARRLLRGAAMVILLLVTSSAISLYWISRVADPSTRFTLKRIKRLIVFLLI